MDLTSLEELRSKAVDLEEKLASIEHSVIHFQIGASTTANNVSAQIIPTTDDREARVVNKFKALQSQIMSLRVQYTTFIRSTITSSSATQTSSDSSSAHITSPAIQNVSGLIGGMRDKAERRWNRLLDLIVALEDSLWDRIQKHAKAISSNVRRLTFLVQYWRKEDEAGFIVDTTTTTANTSASTVTSSVSTSQFQPNKLDFAVEFDQAMEKARKEQEEIKAKMEKEKMEQDENQIALYASEVKSSLPKPEVVLPVNLATLSEQNLNRGSPSFQRSTNSAANQNEASRSTNCEIDDVTINGQNTSSNGYLQSRFVHNQDFLKKQLNQPIGIDLMSPPKEDKSLQVNIILPAKSVYLTHAGCINITCNHCNCLIELPSQVIENLKRVSSRIESQNFANKSSTILERQTTRDNFQPSFDASASVKTSITQQSERKLPENFAREDQKLKSSTEHEINGYHSKSNYSSDQSKPTDMENSIGQGDRNSVGVASLPTNSNANSITNKTSAESNLNESSSTQNSLRSKDSTIVEEQELSISKTKLHREYLKQIKSGYRNIHDVMREIDSSVKIKNERENKQTAEQSNMAITSQSEPLLKLSQSDAEPENTNQSRNVKIGQTNTSTTVQSEAKDVDESEAGKINQSNVAKRSQSQSRTHSTSSYLPSTDLQLNIGKNPNAEISNGATAVMNGEPQHSNNYDRPETRIEYEIPKTSNFTAQEMIGTQENDLIITSTPRFEVESYSEVPKQPTTTTDMNGKHNHLQKAFEENIERKQSNVGKIAGQLAQNGVSDDDSMLQLDQLSPQEVYVSSFRLKMEQKGKTSEQVN